MRYRYYNRRPDGQEIEDCVCRAISTATGLDYYEVADLLAIFADYNNCEKLCITCYDYLIENIFGCKCYDGDNQKVWQIVDNFPDCRLLLRLNGHLTCAIYGTLLDIWDCSNRIVDCFWIVSYD